MAQQNIDFGAFPDDPSADAIRSAFQKVQDNFDEIFTGITSASVSSVNRSAGAGITVNAPTGNVVVTANIANVTISSPNLQFGTSLGVVASSTVYTSSTQTLYVVVPNTFSIGNIIANGFVSANGNITSLNANLGNVVIANYFVGAGNNLSNIQAANITGSVPTANTAGTVSQNAQPNITSLGTLTSLSVTGNITSGNANLGNAVIANYFIGSGANLTNIPAGNITGNAANANYAAYAGDVVNASQSNITSVGTLTSVSVSGNANIGNIGAGIITATGNITGANVIATLLVGNLSGAGNSNVGNLGAIGVYSTTLSATGNANVGNIGATEVVATTITGTLTTGSQPNVTSVGTLISLSVSGNANIGNIGTTGTITTTGNVIGGNLSTPGTLSVTGNTIVGNLSVTGTLDAGNITVDQISNGNSIVDIVGSGGNVTTSVGGNANIYVVTSTGANVSGTFSASGNATVGNLDTGGLITVTGNITGGNINTAGTVVASTLTSNVVTGTAPLTVTSTTQVANLNVATAGKAGTVTTNAQPNITSVGNLTNLTSNGTVNFSNATDVSLGSNSIVHITGGVPGQVLATDGSGNLNWVTYSGSPIAGSNTEVQFKDTDGNLGASANFTFNKTTNTLSVTTITATTANVNTIVATGNINGAQLGTGGNITAAGNIQGAYILGNGSQLSGLPSGTGVANGNSSVNVPTSNGNVVITAVGNIVANITGTGANITGTLSVSGDANVGNIGATNGVFTNVSGNGSALTAITGANVTGTVANATNAGSATTAGTVTTNSQPNITSVGTLTGLVVGGDITPNANITYSLGNNTNRFNNLYLSGNTIILGAQTISANATSITLSGNLSGDASGLSNITGANVTGQVGNALIASTVYTNAQPNITSTGTLVSLSVSGNANVGNIGAASGVFTTVAGTLTTAAQPNITSVGTLTSLSSSGNVTGANIITGGIVSATGNVTGNFFIGNGSQLTGIDATAIQNGNSNVRVLANANVTVSSAGNANIVVVTGTGAIVNGTLSTTGNANVGNLGTGGLITSSGNITGGNLITAGLVSATGNGTFGNISTGGTITSIGNVTAPYFLGNVIGNISGNLVVPGTNTSVLFNQAGNAGASDALKFNYSSNALLVTGTASVTGNSNIGNIGTGGLVTATGNITGGNLITTGFVSATGNVTGNFFIGNGSQLTGIDATSIQNGNSNVKVFANANVTVSSAGNANIVVVTGTGANIAGTLSSSGNITGANIITGGIVSATGNANVGNLGTVQLTATGNIALSGANVSLGAVANLKITGGTANYFLQTDGSGNLVWATASATVAGAYTFTQASPSTSWVINHNLGYQYVNIQLIDSTGNSFTGRYNYPTITFNNTTHCTVTFDSAQAGYAAVSSGGGAQGPTGATGNANIGGSNTQVQFNDAGVFGGSSAFTFNKSSNLVSITSLSITANANVGNIGGSAGVFSTITGNLTTPAQSNITAVGTLVSLSVSGNANVGNLGTGGLVTAIGNVTGANIIATTYNLTGVNTGISAAGSSQGDATALTKAFNVVSTVSAGQGVVLPTAVAGMRITVINTSGATLLVYPASGGAINALATNAGYSLPTLGRLDYIATSTTQWYAMGAIYV